MESKSITEIQKEIDDWVNQFETPYFAPLSQMAALTEEVGEVARVMNRLYGNKKAKDAVEEKKNLEEELGDLLFSLACMANAEKIDLNVAYERKMDKILKRDNNRWERKS